MDKKILPSPGCLLLLHCSVRRYSQNTCLEDVHMGYEVTNKKPVISWTFIIYKVNIDYHIYSIII